MILQDFSSFGKHFYASKKEERCWTDVSPGSRLAVKQKYADIMYPFKQEYVENGSQHLGRWGHCILLKSLPWLINVCVMHLYETSVFL